MGPSASQITEPTFKILIADDNSRTRHGLKALIASIHPEFGNSIIGEAQNGRQAIHLTRLHNPHLVLLDANMPGIDGIQAARIIKKERPSTKIIILSMEKTFREKAISSGTDAFLTKSGPPQMLIEAILKLTFTSKPVPKYVKEDSLAGG